MIEVWGCGGGEGKEEKKEKGLMDTDNSVVVEEVEEGLEGINGDGKKISLLKKKLLLFY